MTEAVPRAEVAPLAPSPSRGPITFQSMADQLTLGEVVTVLAALLVFVSAFLTWATVEVHTSTGTPVAGAITASMGISGGRLGTVTLALSVAVLVTVAGMLVPMGATWMWKVLLGFAALIALLALLDVARIPRMMSPDNFSCPSRVTCTFHRSIGPGTWITLGAGLLVLAGAYLHHWRPLYFSTDEASPEDEPDQPAAAAGTSG